MPRILVHDARLEGRRSRIVDPLPALGDAWVSALESKRPSFAFGVGHEGPLEKAQKGQGVVAVAIPEDDLVAMWLGEMDWFASYENPEILRLGRRIADVRVESFGPNHDSASVLAASLICRARKAAAFSTRYAPMDWMDFPSWEALKEGFSAKPPLLRRDSRCGVADQRSRDVSQDDPNPLVFVRSVADPAWRVRVAAARNAICPPQVLSPFVQDDDRRVVAAASMNPSLYAEDQWRALSAQASDLALNPALLPAVALACAHASKSDPNPFHRNHLLRRISLFSSHESADAVMVWQDRGGDVNSALAVLADAASLR